MNWSGALQQRAQNNADAPCISDGHTTLSNRDFVDRVSTTAMRMRLAGLGAGAVIAVQATNCVEQVIIYFAAWRIGAIVTPVSPHATEAERAYQLRDAQANLLVSALPAVGEMPCEVADLRTFCSPISNISDPLIHETQPDDLALIIYTSGTTGSPKGVMLSHGNINAMCDSLTEAFRIDAVDHSLVILPLFHANAIILSTLIPLRAGAQVTILQGKFSPEKFFAAVRDLRPTYFSAVPTIYALLDAAEPTTTPDLSSIRFAIGGAAPMPAELIQRIESRYGFSLVEGYGLSEGTCASTVNPLYGRRKPGTVGRPLPGQQIFILSADGSPLQPGEKGEVAISGPNVMAGYLRRAEETDRVLTDGVLRTGDVGYIDSDGYLVLVDRIKDMIIRGGENLYPKEIEGVLYGHEHVLEAAVVGKPDSVYGEVPVAFVVPRPNKTLSVEELAEHCRHHLSKFKVPVEVHLVSELPKNPVGKIDKRKLRAQMDQELSDTSHDRTAHL